VVEIHRRSDRDALGSVVDPRSKAKRITRRRHGCCRPTRLGGRPSSIVTRGALVARRQRAHSPRSHLPTTRTFAFRPAVVSSILTIGSVGAGSKPLYRRRLGDSTPTGGRRCGMRINCRRWVATLVERGARLYLVLALRFRLSDVCLEAPKVEGDSATWRASIFMFWSSYLRDRRRAQPRGSVISRRRFRVETQTETMTWRGDDIEVNPDRRLQPVNVDRSGRDVARVAAEFRGADVVVSNRMCLLRARGPFARQRGFYASPGSPARRCARHGGIQSVRNREQRQ